MGGGYLPHIVNGSFVDIYTAHHLNNRTDHWTQRNSCAEREVVDTRLAWSCDEFELSLSSG
jgi:hypothetical protein